MITRARYYVGIDTGVCTGVAIYDRAMKSLIECKSGTITQIMEELMYWTRIHGVQNFFVRVEDARQRTWFGKSGREKLQGAGSVKRDAKIWEDFLTEQKIKFSLVAPKNNKTKLTADQFKKITSWTDKKNQHARDAAMLVYGA